MPYSSTWQNPFLPQYNQGQPVMPMPYQQPVNGIVKVNGRDSALQYNLPPNSTSPALFDSSGTCFYIVTTDGAGAKTVEVFDFTPHVDKPAGDQFVSRREFEDFVAKVSSAIGAFDGVHGPVQAAANTVPEGAASGR